MENNNNNSHNNSKATLNSSGQIETPGPNIAQIFDSQNTDIEFQFKQLQPTATFTALWTDPNPPQDNINLQESLKQNGQSKLDRFSFFNRIKNQIIQEAPEFPTRNYGCSCTADPKEPKVYIYGGMDSTLSFLDQLYEFDLEKKKWRKLRNEGVPKSDPNEFPKELVPKGRHFHVAWIYENYLWIYAGKSNGYQNDLWKYSIENEEWEYVKTKGKKPSPRYGLCCCMGKDKVYLIGGYDNSGMKCEDIYELDLLELNFTELIPLFGKPPPLHHISAEFHRNSIFLFVGEEGTNFLKIFEFSLSTFCWAEVFVKNGKERIPMRKGHTVNRIGEKFFIVGGTDLSCTYSDMAIFDLSTHLWERKTILGMTSRHFHSSTLFKNLLIIFGGTNTSHFFFNDLNIHDLSVWSHDIKNDNSLSWDLRRMFLEEKYTDIVFVFPKENKTIKAHKNIICSRSIYFEKMFSFSMKEQNTGKIEIETDYFIFRLFLEYLYSGELSERNLYLEQLLELLNLAESHFLAHLKSYLEDLILKYISLSNVVSLYTTAEQLNANYLKETCFTFMLKHFKTLVTEKGGEEIPENLETKLKKFLKL